MKFAGGNHCHQQTKWLHFGRNCNRDKGAKYDRKIESTSTSVAAMSNRCWRLANEITNLTAHTTADAIADIICHQLKYLNSHENITNVKAILFSFILRQYYYALFLSTADIDTSIRPLVRCALQLCDLLVNGCWTNAPTEASYDHARSLALLFSLVPCGKLSWQPVSIWSHAKQIVSYT